MNISRRDWQARHPLERRNPLGPRVAVILPCYNEAASVEQVVADFRRALPEAEIHVCDNASSDDTTALASRAGARVLTERHRGKGNVVRRMFAEVDADIYVMADGDATYDAASAPAMVELLLQENLDMVVGMRTDDHEAENYRQGHRFGNRLLTGTVRRIFGGNLRDMLSGYRVFSRRFVKSFPALTTGFEIETELTIHALEQRMPVAEVPTRYSARKDGSESKLSTWKDGSRILTAIGRIYMVEHPLIFFSQLALLLSLAGLLLSLPIFIEYINTGLVPRVPTFILSVGLVLTGVVSFFSGLILDNIVRGRREARRMAYLAIPGPGLE